MNKEQQTPKAKETPAPMPELYVIQFGPEGTGIITQSHSDGIWLWNGAEKIIVRTPSAYPYDCPEHVMAVGYRKPSPPTGPRYTGPIDDETLANILIYG